MSGGGKSDLYGVEPASYYFRNGFNQLQFVLPLALLFPVVALVGGLILPRTSQRTRRAAIVAMPVFVWTAAITMLPHKEERFLYVVYPIMNLLASIAVVYMGTAAATFLPKGIVNRFMGLFVLGSCLLAISRILALTRNYGGSMKIYSSLPENIQGDHKKIHVCIGAEWYRYPSGFFLPGPQYRLQFVKSGFNGLLPRPFEEGKGGTKAAPRQLNDMNREEPQNYWERADNCTFFVTTMDSTSTTGDPLALNGTQWKVLASELFLDAANSPSLTRAFFIPWYSAKHNKWIRYCLLARKDV